MTITQSDKGRDLSERAVKFRWCMVVITAVFLIATGVVFSPKVRNMFPVVYVRIIGNVENLDVAELQQRLEPVSEQGFLDVDLAAVRDTSQQLPWIEKVNVRRVWPDTLEVRVIEHIPFARWGANRLLSDKGVLFSPANTEQFGYLPQLEIVGEFDEEWVDRLQAMNQKLAIHKMEIGSLYVDPALGWSATLRHGVTVVMGRQYPLAVFDRFLKALTLMEEQEIIAMKRVDLRYPQGFTVEWDSSAGRRHKNRGDGSKQKNRVPASQIRA